MPAADRISISRVQPLAASRAPQGSQPENRANAEGWRRDSQSNNANLPYASLAGRSHTDSRYRHTDSPIVSSARVAT